MQPRLVGQAVKTSASHAENMGSIPVRVTKKSTTQLGGVLFLCLARGISPGDVRRWVRIPNGAVGELVLQRRVQVYSSIMKFPSFGYRHRRYPALFVVSDRRIADSRTCLPLAFCFVPIDLFDLSFLIICSHGNIPLPRYAPESIKRIGLFVLHGVRFFIFW